MKLSEIKHRNPTIGMDKVDWFDEEFVDPVDVEVEYDYEGADYNMHPYGSGYAREELPERLELLHVRLKKKSELMDEDGNPSGKFLDAGYDMMNHDAWTKTMGNYVEEKVLAALKSGS